MTNESPDTRRPPTGISIAGHVGSGKSAVSRAVAERTGWRRVSTGAMFRSIAERRGMTVLELNRHAETDPDIDDEIDGHLRRLALSPEPLVIDSRLAWHFVPDSFKVYLVVDPAVGAERVLGASRRDEHYGSVAEAGAANTARQDAEADRYHSLYGIHRDDWRNYDLVVDTTDIGSDRVADLVLDALERARAGSPAARPECHLAARRLVPADPAPTADPETVAVSVWAGTPFITSGHDSVSRALRSGEALVTARLAGFDLGRDQPAPAKGNVLHDAVSPEAIERWEKENAIRFTGLPPWARREQGVAGRP